METQSQTEMLSLQAGGGVEGAMDIRGLVSSFLAAQDVSETSKTLYGKGARKFLGWMIDNGIDRPGRTEILWFKNYLIGSGLAANSINSYLTSVKTFFSFLESSKIYPNIAKDIKGMKQARGHLREAFSAEQIREILDRIDCTTLQGKRDFAIINLLARTGLRTIEVVRANVEDLKQESGEAVLHVQGKARSSKDDFVVLIEPALKPIRAYLRHRGRTKPTDPLFASLSDRNKGSRLTTKSIRHIVKTRMRAADIDGPKLSSHSLRHFFATESLRGGAELQQVQAAMRHSSLTVTQRYLHNLDRIENAAERFINF